MLPTRTLSALIAFGTGALLLFGCSSQVVDAVDLVKRDAGPACPDGGDAFEDGDGDGTPDCADECDGDEKKTTPGTCGCNLPDPVMLPHGAPSCLDLQEHLAHRYTFIGPSGSVVAVDSRAGDDGTVVGTGLAGSGTLELGGGATEQHVNLPNGMVSGLQSKSATFEAWIYWRGGADWQRIFDFGSNDRPEGIQGFGQSYLFLTPRTQVNALKVQSAKLRLVYKRSATEREAIVEAPIQLPSGGDLPTHVAAVVDNDMTTMSLYVDGKLQLGRAIAGVTVEVPGDDVPTEPYEILTESGSYNWSTPLSTGSLPPAVDLASITDVNGWLGRSQYATDPELTATYLEFRIYAHALTPELIAISHQAGPDPDFLPKPPSAGN